MHFLSFKMQPFKVDKKLAEVVGSKCRQGVPETLLQFAVGLTMFIPTLLPLPVYRPFEPCLSFLIQYCDSPVLSSIWGTVLKALELGE